MIEGFPSPNGALGTALGAFAQVSYTLTDLGTLGGSSSAAFGINNIGQIAGLASLPYNSASHAFLDSGGVRTSEAEMQPIWGCEPFGRLPEVSRGSQVL